MEVFSSDFKNRLSDLKVKLGEKLTGTGRDDLLKKLEDAIIQAIHAIFEQKTKPEQLPAEGEEEEAP